MYKHFRIGITSIGYDGEESDLITMLPKPRIKVFPGMLVATSTSCLEKTGIRYQIVCDTGITTAVGSTVIINILSEGFIEVSGPAMNSQIKTVGDRMLSLGCQKIIVDGAAGRLSFAAYADCSILSIGAAVSTDMDKVVGIAKHAVEILSLKSCGDDRQARNSYGWEGPLTAPYAVKESDGGLVFYFRGVMSDKDIIEIMNEYKDNSLSKTAVVKDAAAIFISPRNFFKFRMKNGDIQVSNPVNLAALTINPMSPYGQWFDAEEFLVKMGEAVVFPVYNIKNEEVVSYEK